MGTIKNVLSESGAGDGWEIAAGCRMVGMVENRLEYCSYPKGQGVSSSSRILWSASGQQRAVKGTRCAMGRNRETESFAGEYLAWSLPMAVLPVQGETVCA